MLMEGVQGVQGGVQLSSVNPSALLETRDHPSTFSETFWFSPQGPMVTLFWARIPHTPHPRLQTSVGLLGVRGRHKTRAL